MSTELIQKLRAQTGAGILDVKKALDETGGDYDKALDELRKRGADMAQKKASRTANEGVIASYIHMNKIGVLVELNCETDFVARTDDFQALGKDIAMQIASMSPLYLNRESVPQEVIDKEKEIYKEQADKSKPENVQEKIVEGKLEKFYKETCLLEQTFFKDDSQSIEDLINAAIGKLGENIKIGRFSRLSLDDNEQD